MLAVLALLSPRVVLAGALASSLSLPSEFFLEPATLPSHLTTLLDRPSIAFHAQTPGVTVVQERWGSATLSDRDPQGRTVWTVGLAAGRRLRLGLGASFLHERTQSDFDVTRTDARRGYGATLALGFHERERYLLLSASAFRERQSLAAAMRQPDTLPYASFHAGAWGDFYPRLEARAAFRWGDVTCNLAARWAQTRGAISTVEFQLEGTEVAAEFGTPLLRDEFAGAMVTWPATGRLRLYGGGWAFRRDILNDSSLSLSFYRSLVRREGGLAGLAAEMRLGRGFHLRTGSSAGWLDHDVHRTSASVGYLGDDTILARRNDDDDSSDWYHELATGLGYERGRVRVDTRIRMDYFDLLHPFAATDITLSW